MMKTYEEMAQSALDRIGRYKKRRKSVVRAAAVAAGFGFAALLGFGAWQSGIFQFKAPISSDYPTDPTVPDRIVSVVETSAQSQPATTVTDPTAAEKTNTPKPTKDGGQKGADTDPTNGFCYFFWNRLQVSGPLKIAMENDPDGAFAVLATYRPATANVTSFSYEGKTLAQWAIEAFEENASQEAMENYKSAYTAYMEAVMPSVISRLSEAHIRCERAAYMNNGLDLLVTADELKSLPLEDVENWQFDLASDDRKDAVTGVTDAAGFQIVN